MPAPGILTGGNIFLGSGAAVGGQTATEPLGVFARHPGATPKYALNRGSRAAEYQETMARLYMDIPDPEAFLRTVPKGTDTLAKTLIGLNASGTGGTGFIDFLLTSAQENYQEKAQIVDTLTDNYVAFYTGQEPPAFSYQGVLLNTYQDDQRVWLTQLYRHILRGTRLANRRQLAHLRYDSFVVSGYLESLQTSLTGDAVDHSNFAFNMRVKEMRVVTKALAVPTTIGTGAVGSRLTDPEVHQAGARGRAAAVAGPPPTADPPPTSTEQDTEDPRESDFRITATELLLKEEGIAAALDAGGAITGGHLPTGPLVGPQSAPEILALAELDPPLTPAEGLIDPSAGEEAKKAISGNQAYVPPESESEAEVKAARAAIAALGAQETPNAGATIGEAKNNVRGTGATAAAVEPKTTATVGARNPGPQRTAPHSRSFNGQTVVQAQAVSSAVVFKATENKAFSQAEVATLAKKIQKRENISFAMATAKAIALLTELSFTEALEKYEESTG